MLLPVSYRQCVDRSKTGSRPDNETGSGGQGRDGHTATPMRDRLDALVAVDDDQPHSPLHRIKASTSNPSVGGMKRLLARLESEVGDADRVLQISRQAAACSGVVFSAVTTVAAAACERIESVHRLGNVTINHDSGTETRVGLAVNDERADRNDRTPESVDHGRGDRATANPAEAWRRSGSGCLRASSRTYVSPTGA